MISDTPRVPDRGPWSAHLSADGQLHVSSDDFEHDVLLRVSGDFGGADTKQAYGQFLCDVLTRGCRQAHARQELKDEDGLLAALMRCAGSEHAPVLEAAADEVSRLRVALSQAEERLVHLEAGAYALRQVRQAAVPSAFAQALEPALKPRQP